LYEKTRTKLEILEQVLGFNFQTEDSDEAFIVGAAWEIIDHLAADLQQYAIDIGAGISADDIRHFTRDGFNIDGLVAGLVAKEAIKGKGKGKGEGDQAWTFQCIDKDEEGAKLLISYHICHKNGVNTTGYRREDVEACFDVRNVLRAPAYDNQLVHLQ
jgi:hypothetical protein